jgi:hypothetical protein
MAAVVKVLRYLEVRWVLVRGYKRKRKRVRGKLPSDGGCWKWRGETLKVHPEGKEPIAIRHQETDAPAL